ncbi:hypothetical protein MMC09_001903 [Bachmanniomyces sp. S44760]|nr:hypothetical protein [Bachmanniomyces sp. S44760]
MEQTQLQQQQQFEEEFSVSIKPNLLEKSRAQRILWLLEELHVDYELKTYKRENMLAPHELKKIHPLGKSPILSVQSEEMKEPLVLAESSMIVEYIVDHLGPELAPKKWQEGKENSIGGETEEWLRYRYFMNYAEGTIMTLLLVQFIMSNIKNGPVPFFLKFITNGITSKVDAAYLAPNFKTNLDFLESKISSSPGGGSFIAGHNLSGADIMLSFPLRAAREGSILTPEKQPNLCKYLEMVEERDAYKRAIQKIIDIEGSYDAALSR